MRVEDFMYADVTVAQKGSTVAETRDLMDQEHFRIIFVVDEGGRLAGFLTYDALKDRPDDKEIDSFLARSTLVAQINDPIDKAVSLIKDHNLMVLPVVDEERRVQGVLTPGKIFEDLTELLSFGEGGFWITLESVTMEELIGVLEIFDSTGTELQNVIRIDGREAPQVVLKAGEVQDKGRLMELLQEVVS